MNQPLTPFVKVKDVRAGMKLRADDGFTCLPGNAIRQVKRDDDGLYITCRCGHHYLGGQIGGPFGGFEHNTHYVGLWALS